MGKLGRFILLIGRILRRIATGVSVILLLAVLAGWGRGYWHAGGVSVTRDSLDAGGWRQFY